MYSLYLFNCCTSTLLYLEKHYLCNACNHYQLQLFVNHLVEQSQANRVIFLFVYMNSCHTECVQNLNWFEFHIHIQNKSVLYNVYLRLCFLEKEINQN